MCFFQRGVIQRVMTSRVALSASVSSGLSSARRMCVSPLTFASRSRAAANVSPSRSHGFGSERHHGDCTAGPRYGVTITSTPASYMPFQICHQAGVQP